MKTAAQKYHDRLFGPMTAEQLEVARGEKRLTGCTICGALMAIHVAHWIGPRKRCDECMASGRFAVRESMKRFLVASSARCIEVHAIDVEIALDIGGMMLNQHHVYGSMHARKLPTFAHWPELHRKLVIAYGEDAEQHGMPNNALKRMIEYVEDLCRTREL